MTTANEHTSAPAPADAGVPDRQSVLVEHLLRRSLALDAQLRQTRILLLLVAIVLGVWILWSVIPRSTDRLLDMPRGREIGEPRRW